MPQLNKNQRLIAIGMLEAVLHHIDIAEHLGVSRDTIIGLAARYRVRGTVDDLPRSDRPRVTTPVHDRHIRILHLYDRFFTGIVNCRGYSRSRERPNKRTDSSQQTHR